MLIHGPPPDSGEFMAQKSISAFLILYGLVIAMGLAPCGARADLQQDLSRLLGKSSAEPSRKEMATAIRQALSQGGERAIRTLGRKDGFFRNPEVRIPMPRELRPVDSLLRRLGQGRYADQFVRTLNRAAEQAIPLAADVIRDTVSHMTVRDAVKIVRGPDNAATLYLRKHAGEALGKQFLPIVRQTTANAGVTRSYKRLMARAGPMARQLGVKTVDLDQYVTDRTLDGLFHVLAQEEKRIREHPVARTTELLKKVFGG
jgi:hypothetical protein